ncbi:MAG TPA: hypothetical protein VN289_04115, partial [Paraburkholderia sp.]|nr:hypothetical protein [Paraburkholderia sp.]
MQNRARTGLIVGGIEGKADDRLRFGFGFETRDLSATAIHRIDTVGLLAPAGFRFPRPCPANAAVIFQGRGIRAIARRHRLNGVASVRRFHDAGCSSVGSRV